MERLTRHKDKWPCRIAGGCPAESWIINHGGIEEEICEDCPFEKYINKLAEYEDLEEGIQNDFFRATGSVSFRHEREK